MAAKLILRSTRENKNSYKAQITAKYSEADLQLAEIKMGTDNKTPEFLEKNPNGKVPVLDSPDGSLWESNAIARYIARLSDNGLFGSSPIEAARVEQWIDFSTIHIDSPIQSWVFPLLMPNYFPYDKKKEQGAIATLQASLAVLNGHLVKNTYLVGHHITLADIITWCNLLIGFKQVFDEAFRKPFPALVRWFLTLANQSNFTEIVGEVKICVQPRKFQPPAKSQKPAAEAKGPAATTAAAPSTPAQPDQEEGEPEAKPKPKNPLDELPPSKMQLDGWKRLYSNTPAAKFQQICINGLWNGADVPNSLNNEHFEGWDPEGFCMFFLDYKYPEENTVNYIVMNKVGGFLQRIDYVRKYAFGAMCILKDEKTNTFPIRGLFIFRGHDIPPIMKEECFDIDLYHWQKVDLSDPAQKKRVESILAEDATIDGLENVEVKVFK